MGHVAQRGPQRVVVVGRAGGVLRRPLRVGSASEREHEHAEQQREHGRDEHGHAPDGCAVEALHRGRRA
ncbi:MAG: hypothetical protein WC580_01135, partial [Agrococcus sp.]